MTRPGNLTAEEPATAEAGSARFGSSAPFSLGVEEELFLVDPVAGEQINAGNAVLERLAGTDGTVAREQHACQVELITGVCRSTAEAVRELRRLRGLVVATGAGVLGAGTHPSAPEGDAEITDKARYERIRELLGDAIATGIELERQMEGLYTPHKVKGAVSGCPRNCAESYVKDIGVVAIEGGWEIYVGGAAGSSVRRGDLLTTVATREDAIAVSLTFLQFYREHGEHLERTHRFVERLGLEAVQAAVLDEASGEPARLRERFAIAKAACDPDPWLERHAPAVPKQFADLDTEPAPFAVIPPKPTPTPEPVR